MRTLAQPPPRPSYPCRIWLDSGRPDPSEEGVPVHPVEIGTILAGIPLDTARRSAGPKRGRASTARRGRLDLPPDHPSSRPCRFYLGRPCRSFATGEFRNSGRTSGGVDGFGRALHRTCRFTVSPGFRTEIGSGAELFPEWSCHSPGTSLAGPASPLRPSLLARWCRGRELAIL